MAADGSELRLNSDMEISLDGPAVTGKMHLREDETGFCAVTWGEGDLGGPRSAPEALERLDSTEEFWREWLRAGDFPDHPWRIHLQRSALVLKGLTYSPSGAIVAALTTSLPETPGGERNWDYRYCWIRDSTFSLWAMHTLGFDEEARAFMQFVMGLCRQDTRTCRSCTGSAASGTSPRAPSTTSTATAAQARSGSATAPTTSARTTSGVPCSTRSTSTKKPSAARGTPADRQLIGEQVEAAIAAWPEPDQGIWEARGEPRHYVSSKLMIWVAIDRGARLATSVGREDLASDGGTWRSKSGRRSSSAAFATGSFDSTTRPMRSTPRRF